VIDDKIEKTASESKIFVVSDIHLGWERSNVAAFVKFLDRLIDERPSYLVICGDFLDLWRAEFDDITHNFEHVFVRIKRLGQQGTKIRYVLGNHDYEVREHLAYFDSFPNLEIIGNSLVLDRTPLGACFFIHGHQFDWTLRHCVRFYPAIGRVVRSIYRLRRRLHFRRRAKA